MEKQLYVVDVVVVGHCEIMVEAFDMEEAKERAAATATPFHVMEDGWEYIPSEAIGDEDVRIYQSSYSGE